MRKIVRIARFELSALFFSPVAWIVLIIFTIQSGMGFTRWFQIYSRAQRMGQHLDTMTAHIFSGRFSFYGGVKDTLYLYIPLLTMGLMSREISSGSIKLLLSSPVKVRDIVLGKYLAMMAYCGMLIMILVLFILAAGYSMHAMDYGLVICGLLGLYLLICAYSAIGLYMSTLTAYQVVAAISTLAVLALLNFVGDLFQTNDAVRHITYFLSISGRTERFIDGLISSEDVIYFAIIIVLFLFLTGMKLQAGRESRSVAVKAVRYTTLFSLLFLAGYLSSRPALTGYVDMTATKTQTLTAAAREVIAKMDKPLRITTYVNLLAEKYYRARPEDNSMDEARFDQYRRYIPGLKMDYVYYYDTTDNDELYKDNPGLSTKAIARKRAYAEGMDFRKVLSPDQLRQQIDLRPEKNRLVRIMRYGDRKIALRYYDDMMTFASEEEFTAALKRLVEPETVPRIGFLTGNGERTNARAGDADYKTVTQELGFRYALINQGFDIDTVSLSSGSGSGRDSVAGSGRGGGSAIDTGLTALVIADPKTAFTAPGLEKIKQYVVAGGNLLIAAEPDHQGLLNPVVKDLGVTFAEGRLTQKSQDFAPDFVLAHFSPAADGFSAQLASLRKEGDIVATPGVTGLEFGDTRDSALPRAPSSDTRDSAFHIVPLLVDGPIPVAIALTRKIGSKEQRIVIAGDADFMSTAEMVRHTPRTANFDFTTALFSWLDYGVYPVDTSRPKTYDAININRDGILLARIAFFCVLPLLLLAWGTLLLVIRKRR
jgi:ABC-2 type transport system permease protein